MTDESTVLDKPRREWRVTKDSLLRRVAELEALAESRAEEVEKSRTWNKHLLTVIDYWLKRTALWRRLALAACAAFVVLGAWTW